MSYSTVRYPVLNQTISSPIFTSMPPLRSNLHLLNITIPPTSTSNTIQLFFSLIGVVTWCHSLSPPGIINELFSIIAVIFRWIQDGVSLVLGYPPCIPTTTVNTQFPHHSRLYLYHWYIHCSLTNIFTVYGPPCATFHFEIDELCRTKFAILRKVLSPNFLILHRGRILVTDVIVR